MWGEGDGYSENLPDLLRGRAADYDDAMSDVHQQDEADSPPAHLVQVNPLTLLIQYTPQTRTHSQSVACIFIERHCGQVNWSEYTRPQYSVYVWNRNGGLGYWFVLRQCFFCMQFWHDCIEVKSLNKAIIYFWCNINLLLKWKVCHVRFSVNDLHITLPCLYVTERHRRNRPWRGSVNWCDAPRRQPYRK